MNQGISMEFRPLDDNHLRASIRWREQDVGGGTLLVELTVRNMVDAPKTEYELQADARALAARFARAFADTIEAQAGV
jgi:hypothetical protein